MALNCSGSGIGKCRQRVGRLWAGLFVVLLFVASWFVSGSPVVRAMVAFVPVAALMIAVELTAEPRRKLSSRACWCIRPTRMGGTLPWRRVWHVLLNIFIASSAFLTLLQTRQPNSIEMSLLRLAAGVTLLYSGAELVFELSALLFSIAGYSLPLMHRAPIAARSVGEFWGLRWNIIVSAWLRTFVFWPLARRRFAGAAVVCCFLVSGVFHGWPMLAALGTVAAVRTVAFFVIQGVAVLAEGRLSIHTWPDAVARAWTLVILLGSSPLYIDPGLRLFGF
jgi:hypothetical protein